MITGYPEKVVRDRAYDVNMPLCTAFKEEKPNKPVQVSGFLRQAGVRSTLALPGKSQKGVGGPRETRNTWLALREAL